MSQEIITHSMQPEIDEIPRPDISQSTNQPILNQLRV